MQLWRRTGLSGSGEAECNTMGWPSCCDQSGLSLHLVGNWPVAVRRGRRRTIELALKRLSDIGLSAMALVTLMPLLLAIAVAVKLSSPGTILFRQIRPGRNGAPFAVYKFRTMHAAMCDQRGVRQTVGNDPRVTPLGSFLRRRSLDELPQLLSVLMGQMSLVGPRPHPAGMLAGGADYRDLVPYYHLRHEMRPGLSGWAQANGLRGPTTDATAAKARIAHDLAYIQNFSILLDIRIILKTLRHEFLTGQGS